MKQTRKIPHQQGYETSNYYNSISSSYNELHGEEQLRKLKCIADTLKKYVGLTSRTRILDVGCGTGLSARVFKADLQGIEPAQKLAIQAQFPVIVANAQHLPFCDSFFDVVLCVTVLHNCKNPITAVKEMKRVGTKIWVITILKKSKKKIALQKIIEKEFLVKELIEDNHDWIYVLE